MNFNTGMDYVSATITRILNNSVSSRLPPAGLLQLFLWQRTIPAFMGYGTLSAKTGKVPGKPKQVGHPTASPFTLGTTGFFSTISIFLTVSSKWIIQWPLRLRLSLSIMLWGSCRLWCPSINRRLSWSLGNTPWYGFTTVMLSIYLLKDMWVIPTFVSNIKSC